MGRNGRGCTDVQPGDVGVYGIVDILGDTSLRVLDMALQLLDGRVRHGHIQLRKHNKAGHMQVHVRENATRQPTVKLIKIYIMNMRYKVTRPHSRLCLNTHESLCYLHLLH